MFVLPTASVSGQIKRKQLIIHLICGLYAGGFFLSTASGSAGQATAAEDISRLSEMARATTSVFMQKSFELRMRYQYCGKFISPDDKENLQRIAKRAHEHLQIIAKNQQAAKDKIEDYQADDWDAKYGASGLWRKLAKDLYTTILSRCEIDFYLALASDQPQKNDILRTILAEIDSLGLTLLPADWQLLKAKTLALLGQTDASCRLLSEKELDQLMARSDMRHSTAFRTAIERIKLFGPTGPNQLKTIAEDIARSRCADELELVLSLAILQLKLNEYEAFEDTLSRQPKVKDFVGSLILSDLSLRLAQNHLAGHDLQHISVLEAELAARTAWKNKCSNHKLLLNYLAAAEKFQTPLILYVTAVAFAESSPAKTVNLLIKASNLQHVRKNSSLSISASKIAEQAAQLSYNLFTHNQCNCALVLGAFSNYAQMSGTQIDEELQYFYTVVLNNCGQAEKATELLQKIADNQAASWRNRARVDLIVQAIPQKQFKSPQQRDKLLKQLSSLITDCTGCNENSQPLRTEATAIYCQLLLESKDKKSALKVLNVLTEAETTCDPNLYILKSKALQQLDRLDESIHCMLNVIDNDNCRYAEQAFGLLRQLISRIDQVNSIEVLQDYKKLAQYCHCCSDSRQSAVYLAEAAIISAAKNPEQLSEAEKLLDGLSKGIDIRHVDLLRCRARLLALQSKFIEASRLWAEICQMRAIQSAAVEQRSWQWWRAKFYELDCLAKSPQSQRQDIAHTIDVLENSFSDIPSIWAEKLNELKQQCHSLYK